MRLRTWIGGDGSCETSATGRIIGTHVLVEHILEVTRLEVEVRQSEEYRRWFERLKECEMSRLATTPWDVVEHLKTEEDMALYLEAALDDGDPILISAVIGDIARARGMTDVAAETGADQETSSESVTTRGDSDLADMLRVIKAAGLRLRVIVGR